MQGTWIGFDPFLHLCGQHEARAVIMPAIYEVNQNSPAAEAGVQTDVHYPVPDYLQPCLLGRVDATALPHTEADARSVMTLPCFPELTDAEADAVIAACNLL